MKEGDMVRFRLIECHNPMTLSAPMIGLLIEHNSLMSTCQVLYENKVLSMRSQHVEKAGKKDGLV
jgi:hypothetical protein